MILVENSSFGPSTNSSLVAHQQNQLQSIESCSLNNPFVEFDEFEQLLSPLQSESPEYHKSPSIEPTPFIDDLNLYTNGFDYNSELSDEDLKCLELDLSDCSSQGNFEDDLESLTPSYPPYLTQRDLCQTSMSNYSSVSSTITSIVDDSSLRLVDTRKASYPSSIKTEHVSLFSPAFDNFSNYGSGSSSSSTPSTPTSTIGSTSAVQHLNSLASNALPGFSEICPSRYNSQLECNIFKFDGYQSDSDSDNDLENSTTAPLQLGGCPAAELVLKEEPMDSFMPSITNTLETSMQSKDVSPYCDFESSLMIPKTQMGSFGQLTSAKMEEDQKEGEFPLFTAQSPKPMRLHLHNLTINFRTASPSSSASQLCAPSTSFLPNTYDVPDLSSTSARISQSTSQQLGEQVFTSSPPSYQAPNSALTTLFGQQQCTTETTSPVTSGSRSTMATESDNSSYRGKSRISRSKPHQMQICAVCGDVAACQHYGVLTCEGCKGFFKRTVQKNSKYTCLGNKDCTVDKRRRNRCQFCRFQKCLAVGMVKEVVRTDSLKGRRGRLPSKPKSPQEMPITPPMSTIAALVKAYEDTSGDKANLDFGQYNEIMDLQVIDPVYGEVLNQQVLALLSSSLDTVFAFMEKIPGFSELSEMDKQFLFQSSCLELFALRMAYRITSNTPYVVLCNNIVLHRNQFLYTFPEWLPMIEELSNQLHTMKLDVSAFACLCALTVISGRHGVQDPNKIDQLETKIISSLRDHTVYNSEAQKKANYFSRILSKLSELRTVGEFGHRSIMQRMRQMPMSNLTQEIIDLERKISVVEPCPAHQQSSINMSSDSVSHDLPSIASFFDKIP